MRHLFRRATRPAAIARRLAFAGLAPAAVALCCGVLALSCSSTPDSKGANDLKRDTVMHHEDCDTGSSTAQKVDVNGDGRPDIIHVMKGGKEVCRVVDLNMDGRNDVFIYYDANGNERRRESDFDRDGHPDEIAILKDGVPVMKMRETNFDGKLDTWDTYEGGRLVKRERDTNGDGIIDQWWDFNNPNDPKCAIVSNDVDQDGKPDPQTAVDLCADPAAVTANPAPPPAPSASAPPAPMATASGVLAPSTSAMSAPAVSAMPPASSLPMPSASAKPLAPPPKGKP